MERSGLVKRRSTWGLIECRVKRTVYRDDRFGSFSCLSFSGALLEVVLHTWISLPSTVYLTLDILLDQKTKERLERNRSTIERFTFIRSDLVKLFSL